MLIHKLSNVVFDRCKSIHIGCVWYHNSTVRKAGSHAALILVCWNASSFFTDRFREFEDASLDTIDAIACKKRSQNKNNALNIFGFELIIYYYSLDNSPIFFRKSSFPMLGVAWLHLFAPIRIESIVRISSGYHFEFFLQKLELLWNCD